MQGNRPRRWRVIAVVQAVILVACVAAAWLLLRPAKLYTVADQGKLLEIKSYSNSPAEVLREAGVELRPQDDFWARGTHINIRRAQTIRLIIKNEEITAYSFGETVGSLLKKMQVDTQPPWQVSVSLQEKTYDGMTVYVDHREQKEELRVCDIAYETVFCQDPSLPEGQQEIIAAGVCGKQEKQMLVSYCNGVSEAETVLSEKQILAPKAQIVAVGTGQRAGQSRQYPLIGDGLLVTEQGQCLYFSYADTYNATAYTSWVADVTGTTACGTPARVGAVAVDPKVIPYFTKMYIVSCDGVFDYGVASAEDCGGAVKGKIIDLFFDTLEECYRFGRRDITVYFLTEEPV